MDTINMKANAINIKAIVFVIETSCKTNATGPSTTAQR